MIEAAVHISGLQKIYEPSPKWLSFLLKSAISEPIVALDDVDLTVQKGEICAVVGPNGAGKSTLFRVLTGLTTSSSGVARVGGFDCGTESHRVRRLVGFMPADDRTLLLRYSCIENLLFHGRLRAIPERKIRARIDSTLELVGLGDAKERAGFALSSGMRSRLLLARALLHHPDVLILDEPTGPVDPISAYELLATIRDIATERGVAVLLSSHRLEEIEALHQSVALLEAGRLIYRGNLTDLRDVWQTPALEMVFSSAHEAEAARSKLSAAEVQVLTAEDNRLTLQTDRSAGEIAALVADQASELKSINEAKLPLRDLFTLILGRGAAASSRNDNGARRDASER